MLDGADSGGKLWGQSPGDAILGKQACFPKMEILGLCERLILRGESEVDDYGDATEG